MVGLVDDEEEDVARYRYTSVLFACVPAHDGVRVAVKTADDGNRGIIVTNLSAEAAAATALRCTVDAIFNLLYGMLV